MMYKIPIEEIKAYLILPLFVFLRMATHCCCFSSVYLQSPILGSLSVWEEVHVVKVYKY